MSHQLENVHTTVSETSLRHKSNDGTVSSRTVMRYNATPPEATTDRPVEKNQPNMLERDSVPINAGTDIFVAHKWGRTDKLTSDKRIITPRKIHNVSKSGDVFNAMETDASESDVFPEKDKEGEQGEATPETYDQAVKDSDWRDSMLNESAEEQRLLASGANTARSAVD